ncbi:related to lysophosphatidic acid acyltransferase endophilin/SH3GL, involved in synaptic vesicle formation [Cephalotrichum gorgonifer]|uniref:Related to lysophosphatidic acid acyltransferase endophilin/SH3GL, involved in synaptic vesicle formation n=1 Tax=Cephalotrichum gorgonifer TaxID=2041049 RepID=A0AAE8MSE0_9PEZI|nr:related to lysophosphatidic acid acyltransferase endophilin/SH3GL, involved in synaptic vesicle formation [Cephalotrichum gorgonifer]
MKITKKFDRAFQWAGERMGAESNRTTHSDEFKSLETEMGLRIDGMERMHKSMTGYVKWVSRRDELLHDKEKALPGGHVGRIMVSHGEDFEADSDFGNSLITVGRANERVASLQEQYASEITSTWLESLDRNLAMMKEYQNARKKLESRRLALDTAITKAQKSKKEDFRLEEEARSSKAKFEEANDDILRRMQDIKEAETDSLRELTAFLDAQLDFHDRCTEELRRARADLGGMAPMRTGSNYGSTPPRPRARQQTYERTPRDQDIYEDYEPEPVNSRMGSRMSIRRPPPEVPVSRPAVNRTLSGASNIAPSFHSTFSERERPERRASVAQQPMAMHPANLRGQLRPVARVNTEPIQREDVFADYEDGTSDSTSGSPRWERGESGWGRETQDERCVSPATSFGSRSTTGSYRKAPPPPPPSRAKKPAPPIPPKRGSYYQ